MESEKCIEIYFDGLCEPVNPNGVATYGYVIYEREKSGVRPRILASGCGVVGEGRGMTNNVAEYTGILKALTKLAFLNIDRSIPIIIRGDSRLAIEQLMGTWKIKSATSRKFVPKIRKIIRDENLKVSFQWVERSRNRFADSLSRQAYKDHCRS